MRLTATWIQILLVSLACALCAGAQTADEVLLVVNDASDDSRRVAEDYAALRGIPATHIVQISVPRKLYGGKAEVSERAFRRYVWEPVSKAVSERGLENQILAWVFSVDFPVRVLSSPPTSLMGAVFVRNVLPDAEAIRHGTYLSPLYAGPDPDGPRGVPTRTLREMKDILGAHMPLPSMMLGYTGEGGNEMDAVRACLERGAAADDTRPRGRFFFCTSEDVRSTCRDWQYQAVAEALRALGQEATILPYWPTNAGGIMGMLVGRANVPGTESNRYLPGAMCEHLTSASAMFHSPGQERLTKWIKVGCTASAGAVTEPFAIWAKFPHARFYEHYVNGATMLESFALAVRCPMQLLLVGDPLARPWGRPAGADEGPAPATDMPESESHRGG